MKAFQQKIGGMAILAILALGFSFPCYAQENAKENVKEENAAATVNTTMIIIETTNALEEAKEGAAVVKELKEGELVVVTKQVDDNWTEILINEKTAYIASAKIAEPPVNEALLKEMEQMASQEVVEIEAFERQRKEAMRARIWGAVIIVLILGIFGMGVVSTLKASKDNKADEKKKELVVLETEEEKSAGEKNADEQVADEKKI